MSASVFVRRSSVGFGDDVMGSVEKCVAEAGATLLSGDEFCDIAFTWGIRGAQEVAARCGRHIVCELGFLGERSQAEVYVGHSGLNGYGQPLISPMEKKCRGERFYHALRPMKGGERRVVVFGQVATDTSLLPLGPDDGSRRAVVSGWLRNTVAVWRARGYEVAVRAHPYDPVSRQEICAGGVAHMDSMEEALEWGDIAVAFNSNALVDAALHGLYVVPSNVGSLTWSIRSAHGAFRKLSDEDRRAWVDLVACYQWNVGELKEAVRIALAGV